jgi:hypothetical protein
MKPEAFNVSSLDIKALSHAVRILNQHRHRGSDQWRFSLFQVRGEKVLCYRAWVHNNEQGVCLTADEALAIAHRIMSLRSSPMVCKTE